MVGLENVFLSFLYFPDILSEHDFYNIKSRYAYFKNDKNWERLFLGGVTDFVPLSSQISKNLDIQNEYFLYIFKNISPSYSFPSF